MNVVKPLCREAGDSLLQLAGKAVDTRFKRGEQTILRAAGQFGADRRDAFGHGALARKRCAAFGDAVDASGQIGDLTFNMIEAHGLCGLCEQSVNFGDLVAHPGDGVCACARARNLFKLGDHAKHLTLDGAQRLSRIEIGDRALEIDQQALNRLDDRIAQALATRRRHAL